MPDHDYRDCIGIDVERARELGIESVFLSELGSGMGSCEKRGCRLRFGPDGLCDLVVVGFDMANTVDVLGLNHGATRADARRAFGLPVEAGWRMVRENWFLPELIDVYRHSGMVMSCIFTVLGERLRWIVIERRERGV